jgi:hypothetical protein
MDPNEIKLQILNSVKKWIDENKTEKY